MAWAASRHGTRCRQQLLLAYFDELDAAKCGVCDVCLAEKKEARPAAADANLRPRLLQLLTATPQTPRELLTQFQPREATAVTEAVRELLEAGQLRYRSSGQLEVVE